jgi:hypothetical protein
MWPERTIRSLEDIQKLSATVGARWPNSDRCLFRGQSRTEWNLLPSLARELMTLSRGKPDWYQTARLERELSNNFRKHAHGELAPKLLSVHDFMMDWWPLMRHYGAPTRVLDWSLSPYVALYFAVERDWDLDGALWWFRASASDNYMGGTYGDEYTQAAKAIFEDHDADVFWPLVPPNILFHFDLKHSMERIGNQQGIFTVCLNALADHAEALAGLTSYGDGPHLEKLVIPKEQKPDLLRQLHLMNVTGKSMFPGLDGLGRSLTEITRLSILYGVP